MSRRQCGCGCCNNFNNCGYNNCGCGNRFGSGFNNCGCGGFNNNCGCGNGGFGMNPLFLLLFLGGGCLF
ncbi:MAG: hypothetical protein RR942_05750 [Romboutsia sp.]